jgi:hypothetical protein
VFSFGVCNLIPTSKGSIFSPFLKRLGEKIDKKGKKKKVKRMHAKH